MKKQKILVIGGTGAMGIYLIPELLRRGFAVDVLSMDQRENRPDLTYYVGDAFDRDYLRTNFLEKHYDAIVDFMIYRTERFQERYEEFLRSTKHYIYLSSYRVYANKECPIRETSPRLLDVSEDAELLASDDYCLRKARGEDILKKAADRNWTIVRPAVTYSSRRFQLVTLEMPQTVGRAYTGRTVVLPEEAKNVQGTMTWAGDVAKMIAGLLLREDAFGETFTVSTAEHHSWGEIADYYRELTGMKVIWVSSEEFFQAIDAKIGNRWQLNYDRLYERVMDNSKILNFLGMKQSDLMPLYDGIKRELSTLPEGFFAGAEKDSMDAWLEQHR